MSSRLLSLSLSVLLFVALGPLITVAQTLPLPGPGLELPVDVDGDGRSTCADQYTFNFWLGRGGSLTAALSAGSAAGSVLDLSGFFTSRASALSDDAPVTIGGAFGDGGGAILQQQACDVEFTRRIPSTGVPNQASNDARITPSGRFIVFSSAADLLGIGTTVFQIYRVEIPGFGPQVIKLVSRDAQGNPATLNCNRPSISDDGSRISFDTADDLCPAQDTNGLLDVYLRDLTNPANEQTRLLSFNPGSMAGNGPSQKASISGDGSTVVFTSSASDLDPSPACTPPCQDGVFRVNADGTGLVDRVSVSDCPTDPISDAPCRTSSATSVGDVVDRTGLLIVFQGAPTNWDSMEGLGLYNPNPPNPPAFQQIFLRDLRTPAAPRTFLVSGDFFLDGGNGNSIRPSIDADGTRIVFSSRATSFIGDTSIEDIFFVNVADAVDDSTTPCSVLGVVPNPAPKRVSTDLLDADPNSASSQPMISARSPAGAHRVAFESLASDLVASDGNGRRDIFVRAINADNSLGPTVRLSVSTSCAEVNGDSTNPDLSHLGTGTVAVVYQSRATNLIPSDGNPFQDIFETKTLGNFERGDANSDGKVDISDTASIQEWLFLGGPPPECVDSADANDDGLNDLSDVVFILEFLFLDGPPPPAPGPDICGTDPTADTLLCERNTSDCD